MVTSRTFAHVLCRCPPEQTPCVYHIAVTTNSLANVTTTLQAIDYTSPIAVLATYLPTGNNAFRVTCIHSGRFTK